MAVRILESVKTEEKLRKMSNSEYAGYQGAVPLPSGEGPLIASGETADVIVSGDEDEPDKAWVQVITQEDDVNRDGEYIYIEYAYPSTLEEDNAITLGNKISKYVDSDIKILKMVLRRLKFKPLFM